VTNLANNNPKYVKTADEICPQEHWWSAFSLSPGISLLHLRTKGGGIA